MCACKGSFWNNHCEHNLFNSVGKATVKLRPCGGVILSCRSAVAIFLSYYYHNIIDFSIKGNIFHWAGLKLSWFKCEIFLVSFCLQWQALLCDCCPLVVWEQCSAETIVQTEDQCNRYSIWVIKWINMSHGFNTVGSLVTAFCLRLDSWKRTYCKSESGFFLWGATYGGVVWI